MRRIGQIFLFVLVLTALVDLFSMASDQNHSKHQTAGFSAFAAHATPDTHNEQPSSHDGEEPCDGGHCHIGHCAFIVNSASAESPYVYLQTYTFGTYLQFQGPSLEGLKRPPRA